MTHKQDAQQDDTGKPQNIVKPYEIALDIAIRVRDAVTHPCLSGKVDHYIYLVFSEYLIN